MDANIDIPNPLMLFFEKVSIQLVQILLRHGKRDVDDELAAPHPLWEHIEIFMMPNLIKS